MVMKTLQRVKKMIPPLSPEMHKGMAGRIGVIGGSEDYTGAPFYSCMSAMLFGADLGHVICEPGAATVVKSYSPDLIVHPLMRQAKHATKDETAESIAAEIEKLLERLHAVVIGPGLGRDSLMQETAAKVISIVRKRKMPLVLDADGLFLVQNHPEVIKGYASAVLTPNVMEFKRLCDAVKLDPDQVQGGKDKVCAELARKLEGVTIIQKGRQDVISNGRDTMIVDTEGGLKRTGGQGDVLTGCLVTLLAWKKLYSEGAWKHDKSLRDEELTALAAFGACCTARYCSHEAFVKHKRAMQASDMVKEVGGAYQALFEGESPKL